LIHREKIEEWIKEVQERPASAPVILQYIANRLRDLTQRNEQLLAEVIELQSGKRVEEYEKRITHLEYQLELLKRQIDGDLSLLEEASLVEAGRKPALVVYTLLVYNAKGRVLKIQASPIELSDQKTLGNIQGDLAGSPEPVRLLVTQENEELLFVFTSGRITTAPASNLPAAQPQAGISQTSLLPEFEWESAPVPSEPHGGESLACIAPISRLALAEFFIQSSRRGYLKKIRAGMADSILENRFIGTGIKKTPDRTFDVLLCTGDERMALVTWEGYLLCLEVKNVPISIEEVIRLGTGDHLAAAFILPPEHSVLAMTNVGKTLHYTGERIEIASSFKTRGQAIFSGSRRAQGVRVIGAAAVKEDDYAFILDRTGCMRVFLTGELFGSGTLPEGVEPLAFTALSIPSTGK
jgi:DNA gyrase/topoisomerase IV subunit A